MNQIYGENTDNRIHRREYYLSLQLFKKIFIVNSVSKMLGDDTENRLGGE
jgi:hypothetical protein